MMELVIRTIMTVYFVGIVSAALAVGVNWLETKMGRR